MIWMPTLLVGRLMGAEIGGKPRLQQGLSLKSNDLSTLYMLLCSVGTPLDSVTRS